jgi:hypothetical protein
MKICTTFLTVTATVFLTVAANATICSIPQQATSATAHYIPNESQIGGGLVIELPPDPSARQQHLLQVAYQTAKRDGHSYPQILQGIIMQESKAGTMKKYKVAGNEFGLKPNKRYYGVAQLKLAAAHDVLKKFPSLWADFNFQTKTDEEVIAKLIENDEFNIAVASKYLLILRSYGFTTPHALAIAYNRGPGGAKNAGPVTNYSRGVMEYIAKLK